MKKILIVEGTWPVEGLSGSLFRRRECVLEVASSGAEALTLSESEKPDLVIFDERVGDMAVEDFIAALDSAEGRKVPVIALLDAGEDGLVDPAREEAMVRAGAFAGMTQPVDDIELNSKACAALGIAIRRHLRTFVKMKVDATVGSSTHFATISDISLGGVRVDSERPIEIGEFIKLSFFLPGDDVPITVITKVVREAGAQSRSYGCEFLDLSEPMRQRIHEFVSAADPEDE